MHVNTNLAEWAGSWLVRSDRWCKHLHMTVTCNTCGRAQQIFLSAVNWICIGCWFDSLITLLNYVPLRLDHFPVWLVAGISVDQHQVAGSVAIGSHPGVHSVDSFIKIRCINSVSNMSRNSFIVLKGSASCIYLSVMVCLCVQIKSNIRFLFFPINYIHITTNLTKPCAEWQLKVCTHFEICCKLNLIGFT